MELVIIAEPTGIKDEQTEKEALRFTIGRQAGNTTHCAVRVEIPVDANDPHWFTDIHFSKPQLDQLQNNVEKSGDLDWFKRRRQRNLIKLLWRILDDIIQVEYSPQDGFDHLIEDYPDSSRPAAEPLPPAESLAARRGVVAVLRLRDPQFLRFNIAELRKKLFKEQKHWVVIPSGASIGKP